ncbi:MAG: hypothetical protein KAS38_19475, partial [Anaerolineales bacterium]|nr:hypothetical protein [Anaerolineales bacterium]
MGEQDKHKNIAPLPPSVSSAAPALLEEVGRAIYFANMPSQRHWDWLARAIYLLSLQQPVE